MNGSTVEQPRPLVKSWPVLVLGLIGLAVSLYLVSIKLFPSAPFCFGVGDCEAVNTSIYSEIRGIPIAIFGALAYAAILILLLLERRIDFLAEWGPLIEFGLAFAGVLYSAYLTYIEIAVIHKICPYCVISAITITLIAIVSAVRVARMLRET
jgi:uncharacterized membrane protein